MSKIYRTSMAIGRFTPPHKGHGEMFNLMKVLSDNPLVFVGSAQESGTVRNPFKLETRIAMLEAAYPNIQFVPLKDLRGEDNNRPDWGDYLLDSYKEVTGHEAPDLMVYGNDNSRSNWFNKERISGISEHIISRSQCFSNLSATAIRAMILLRDECGLQKYLEKPVLDFVPQMLKEMLEVPEYRMIDTYLRQDIAMYGPTLHNPKELEMWLKSLLKMQSNY